MTRLVPAVSPKSTAQIEQEAYSITERFYPNLNRVPGSFPVMQFFDFKLRKHFGLDPSVEELSPGVEGMTWPDGRVAVSEDTYRQADEGGGRARFTIIHEGCHGIFHRSQIQRALSDTGELVLHRRTDLKPYRDPEWQANTFASALLMPEHQVRLLAQLRGTTNLIDRLMEVFQVSRKAAEVRLQKLKILGT